VAGFLAIMRQADASGSARMRIRLLLSLLLVVACPLAAAAEGDAPYYPDGTWQRKTPAESGFNAERLKAAIDCAIAGESRSPRDLLMTHYQVYGREPFSAPIGPFRERGSASGLIVRHGYIVAEWGEPARIDVTYSVTKSFLSSVVGVAFDRGMIKRLDDAVRDYVPPIEAYNPGKAGEPAAGELIMPFETAHNRTITWDHMLRQTSDWEGTLWGKPDWADRPESYGPDAASRARHPSGTVYKYNDVRVNVLALAALSVWRRPLPQVLKDDIMDPIGASNSWRWYGYENSWVVLDGELMQSVSGGAHWGGGMFINSYDMGRFGYLTLRHGKWKDRQLLSDRWVNLALTPTPVEPTYGFMNWFLNTNKALIPSAPTSAFAHIGLGNNIIYVDPENDVVAVMRWIDGGSIDGCVRRLLAALDQHTQ
jgi:CubicO group peptidase (beta-lactamase class C family)